MGLRKIIADNFKEVHARISSIKDDLCSTRIRLTGLETWKSSHLRTSDNIQYDEYALLTDLHTRVAAIERAMTCISTVPDHAHDVPQLEILQKQIRCGVEGHKFELTLAVPSLFVDTEYDGQFKCKACGLEITTKLDDGEIESAKNLGMIQGHNDPI